jgi:hypothetical protein
MGGVGKAADRFGNAVGAGRMIRRGHDGVAAKSEHRIPDPGVIGGDDEVIESRAVFATLPNMLDEGFSSDAVKRFPGEAGGAPARRKDA